MANEKRLIPLNKRIVYGGDVFNSLMSEKGWSATEASDFVKEFRTVDAVEVVRCKDCKHLKYGYQCYCPLGMRLNNDGDAYVLVDPDEDFCSMGERRAQ